MAPRPLQTAGVGVVIVIAAWVTSGMACTPALQLGAGSLVITDTDEREQVSPNEIVRLLDTGQAVFGVFSGEKTAEQGARIVENRETDFVFYSLETGPFDIPAMQVYMRAMAEAGHVGGAHAVVLRIPPIRDGRDLARERVREGLDAGVDGIVFPHVETADEAALAVSSMGTGSWPANPEGGLLNILLIEDQIGVRNAREIVGTPGVGVVIPGPGDLRRAYGGDADAIEGAIQTVLSACKEFDVPCGITAGADDIAERLEQGFRLIIVNRDDALAVGRAAAGRRASPGSTQDQTARLHENTLIDLWVDGTAAFGVYVPNERPSTDEERRSGKRPQPLYTREGGERLARNPLYDFVFLNLEGSYDAGAVAAIAEGLRSPNAVGRKTLLVRIPPIERDGEEVARARVREILEFEADGVILPHVRSSEEARMAVSFFSDAGADVWSPANPTGEVLAMIMIEDPGALAAVAEIADTPGYSILACGIGSLTRALDGDRESAEAGNQEVLSHAKRVGVADMITADAQDIEERVQQGFVALLMQGPEADDVIRIGRAAAGR